MKSYVTMERKICLACGKEFDSGSLLVDTRFRNRFNTYTTTGFGLCEEHQKLINDGYIIFVGCDFEKTKIENDRAKPEDWYRTGEMAYIRKNVAENIFNVPMNNPVFPCDSEVINKLHELTV